MAHDAGLPPRYELRSLKPEHVEWAAAIFLHTNLYDSPWWPALCPGNMTARLRVCMRYVDHLIRHQIESGYSLGVFDTQFPFKRDEAKALGGKLYWDADDESANGEQLLEQMDFPLVSIALAYDGANRFDPTKMKPFMETLPLWITFYAALERMDTRPRESWAPQKPGEVLMRNSTSTRRDYCGLGLAKKTAQCMMHRAADDGFRGIQIETASSAVEHIWANPPPPYSSQVVSALYTETYTGTDDNGKLVYPFRGIDQKGTKIYCTLKARS